MKNDKTQVYSDGDRTSIYGQPEKRTKESVHKISSGDKIQLNGTEFTVKDIVCESSGEAVLYKVEDVAGNIYALKLYYEFHDPEHEPNTEALERIKNINDPDILKLIDYGAGKNKYKGKYCFEISDFAYGHDLLYVEDLKKKYTATFLEEEVIPQIFDGILKLHENKIYHCDLKPQNVFFLDKEQKEIVIGDYGSAKTFNFDAEKSSRKTTVVRGTDFYLPPEQARGFISEKNDYYSFGMILLHLFYPEKILSEDLKNLSRIKLKHIIERQFEAKPIIEFDQKFKRINSLIEGLTLEDFNLRWGKEEVELFLKGEDVKVQYKSGGSNVSTGGIQAETALIFGNYTLNTVYDIRDYILNDPDWYQDLVEDKDNRQEFTEWFVKLYGGNRSRRSEFNRIIKDYSQDGIEFVSDALIRFFVPDHPVILGLKTFDFYTSKDIKKTTAYMFHYLLNDLWKTSSEKELKLYMFRFEFALGQLNKNKEEVTLLLTDFYNNLGIRGRAKLIFFDYDINAYHKVSKKSKIDLERFLCSYLPAEAEIDVTELKDPNLIRYKLKMTLSAYYRSLGIDDFTVEIESEEQIKMIYPKGEHDFENFIEITSGSLLDHITEKHGIKREKISEHCLSKITENIKPILNKFLRDLKLQCDFFRTDYKRNILKDRQIRKNISEIRSIVNNKECSKLIYADELLTRTKDLAEKRKQSLLEKSNERYERRGVIIGRIFFILFFIILAGMIFHESVIHVYHYFRSMFAYENIEEKNEVLEKIEMVYAEGGTFMMGHKNGPEDEVPFHSVELTGFYLSKYEITNEQYCWFLNIYGSDTVKYGEFSGQKMFVASDLTQYDWGIRKKKNKWRPKRGFEDHPVIFVTWYGANEFCKWAGGRLPSEAEWEYAARGGTKTEGYSYPGGNDVDEISWYDLNSEKITHKVGKKLPNELGLYDMGGNVYEWCQDWYDKKYYSRSPQKDPVNNTPGEEKVMRGSTIYSWTDDILPCNRIADPPDDSFNDTGFRLCRDSVFITNEI